MFEIIYFGSQVHVESMNSKVMLRNPYASYATRNREMHMIKLFKIIGEGKSIINVSTAYGEKKGYFKTLNLDINRISYVYLGYYGPRLLRLLSSYINSFVWIIKNISSKSLVIVYNFPIIYAIPLLIKKIFCNFKLIIEFEDFFNQTDFRFYIYHPFELLGIRYASAFIASSSGMRDYLLSKNISSKVVVHSGYCINYQTFSKRFYEINGVSLLYSGSLDTERGILKLINIILSDKSLNIDLFITGHGNLVGKIREYANEDFRIKYLGLLGVEDFAKLMHEVIFCINIQDQKISINFPSKITHYLSYGNIVFSTKIKSLRDSPFSPLLVYFNEEDPLEFLNLIEEYSKKIFEIIKQRKKRIEIFNSIMHNQDNALIRFISELIQIPK